MNASIVQTVAFMWNPQKLIKCRILFIECNMASDFYFLWSNTSSNQQLNKSSLPNLFDSELKMIEL